MHGTTSTEYSNSVGVFSEVSSVIDILFYNLQLTTADIK